MKIFFFLLKQTIKRAEHFRCEISIEVFSFVLFEWCCWFPLFEKKMLTKWMKHGLKVCYLKQDVNKNLNCSKNRQSVTIKNICLINNATYFEQHSINVISKKSRTKYFHTHTHTHTLVYRSRKMNGHDVVFSFYTNHFSLMFPLICRSVHIVHDNWIRNIYHMIRYNITKTQHKMNINKWHYLMLFRSIFWIFTSFLF